MRATKCLWSTYKEIPKDAEIISHQLLLRAGLIHKTGAGLFDYLPLMQKSIRKMSQIIIEEMENISCFELQMSVVTPSELWMESGRWDVMGPLMLKIQDRHEKKYCFSPTNEEAVVNIFRKYAKSYKSLPVAFHQVNTKFRDEIRPRFGLLRGREFLMHDAYSFHANKEDLDAGYEKFYQAYQQIFERVGLEFLVVEADGGAIASSQSKTHEFQVLAQSGEDTLVYCEETRWAANIEKSITLKTSAPGTKNSSPLEKISTPKISSIEDLTNFFKQPSSHFLKALFYKITFLANQKTKFVLALICGDDELNEVKLKNFLGADEIFMGSNSEAQALELAPGYFGPLDTKFTEDFTLLIDQSIDLKNSYICGANAYHFHYQNFSPSRDLKVDDYQVADIRLSQEGDLTLDKKHQVKITKGIEVGHIFQLGDKYSKKLQATVLDESGKPFIPLMGTYGIGVTRTIASALEQSFDENGIIWPISLAPYHIHLCGIFKDQSFIHEIDGVYEKLKKLNFEVFYDDRFLSPGVTFKDSDLLGLPFRLLITERDFLTTNLVELKLRTEKEVRKIPLSEAIQFISDQINSRLGLSL
ncbi:MAG: proline--tRNA ligase [Bacteriovoracaceae bacterium]|nr:proline--tRNA ligase [Bacteriovoracaceae bacterium]